MKRFIAIILILVALSLFNSIRYQTGKPNLTIHNYLPEVEAKKEFSLKIGETTKLKGTNIELKLIGLEQPPENKDCGEWCFFDEQKYVKTELRENGNLINSRLNNKLLYQINFTSSDYKTFANFVFLDLVARCQEMQEKKDIEIDIINCWTSAAVKSEQIALCNNIIGTDKTKKTACLEEVAARTTNIQICNEIKNNMYKYCGYKKAVENNDLVRCESLLDNYDIPCIKDIFTNNNWNIDKCSSLKNPNNKENTATIYLRCIQVISGNNWFRPTTVEECDERFKGVTALVCQDYVKFVYNN